LDSQRIERQFSALTRVLKREERAYMYSERIMDRVEGWLEDILDIIKDKIH